MEEVLNAAMVHIFPVIVALVGAMISIAINRFTVYIKTKTTNASVEFAIERLSHTIDTVVAALTQTTVVDIKKASEDGKLTSDDARKIKNDAVNEITKIVNENVVAIIKSHVGDFDEFVSNKIEQAVIKLKV